MRVLETRAGQAEVVQPVLQRHAGQRDVESGHVGEIRQPQATGLVYLAEDHLALRAVDGTPGTDAPLQGAPDGARELRMPSNHLLEDRDRPQPGGGLEQRNDFGIEDRGQWIGAAAAARGLPPAPSILLILIDALFSS